MQTKMTWKVRVLSLVLICLALLALSLLTDISTNTRSSAVCGQANGSRMQDQAARVARCGWPVPDATLAHMRVEAGDEFYSGNFLGIQQLCEFYRARCALGVLVLDALRYSLRSPES
jgi:hypothetical protein